MMGWAAWLALGVVAGFILGAALTAFCLIDYVMKIQDAREEGFRLHL